MSKSDVYQIEAFLPGMAHLHGGLNFPASTKQTFTGTLIKAQLKMKTLTKSRLHSQIQNLPLMGGLSVHHVDPLFLQGQAPWI